MNSQVVYLTALEHKPLPIQRVGDARSLSIDDVAALATIGELRKGFCTVGAKDVRLAQYCGIVPLGNRVLEILPKVHRGDSTPAACRGILLRLLRLAGKFPHFSYKSAGQDLREIPLLEIFIAAFVQSVVELIRSGFLKKYEWEEDDLRVVRGRINFLRQFGTHANRPDVIACGFDDLTTDNVWNRLLKRALRVCQPWIVSPDVARKWTEVFAAFEDVEDVSLTARDVELLSFDRQGERYRTAIGWARWILSMLAPTLRAGMNQAPALLFDMNRLFEAAIANLLIRRAHDTSEFQIATQDTSLAFANVTAPGIVDSTLDLRPDIVIRRGSRAVCIADTKWKQLELDSYGRVLPKEADLYQMAAYASSYGCEELALLYPWCAELSRALETEIRVVGAAGKSVVFRIVCIGVEDDAMPIYLGARSLMGNLFNAREPAQEIA